MPAALPTELLQPCFGSEAGFEPATIGLHVVCSGIRREIPQPCKGDTSSRSFIAFICFAPSGLNLFSAQNPGRCPGLFMWCPVGALLIFYLAPRAARAFARLPWATSLSGLQPFCDDKDWRNAFPLLYRLSYSNRVSGRRPDSNRRPADPCSLLRHSSRNASALQGRHIDLFVRHVHLFRPFGAWFFSYP